MHTYIQNVCIYIYECVHIDIHTCIHIHMYTKEINLI